MDKAKQIQCHQQLEKKTQRKSRWHNHSSHLLWKKRWFFSQLFRNYETWIYRSFWLAPAPLEASDKPGTSWMSGAWNELFLLLNIWVGNWYVFLWALRSGLEAEQEILEKVHESLTYQAFNIFWEIPLLCIERRRIIILGVRSHLKHANLQGDPRN